MAWEGREHTDAPLYVKPVELYDRGVKYGVAPRATYTFTGADGAPDLRAECAVVDGVPRVTELHIVEQPGGRPILDADLHQIQLELLARIAFRPYAMRLDDPEQHAGSPSVEFTYPDGTKARLIGNDEAGQLGVERAMKSAQKRPDATSELERVATIYKQYFHDAPTAHVASLLGLTPRTAARRVSQAAKAGLLTERSHRGRRRYPDDFKDAE